ncbi:hypothetical protein, partial [Caldovatus aquaticus]
MTAAGAGPFLPVILGLLALAAAAAALCAHRRGAAAAARAAAAERRAAAAERRLGLAAAELRGPGLSLAGRAERLLRALAAAGGGGSLPAAEARAEAEALAAVLRDLRRASERLEALLALQSGSPALHEETFPLRPLLEEAIAAVAAEPGAAGRHWRIAPELGA